MHPCGWRRNKVPALKYFELATDLAVLGRTDFGIAGNLGPTNLCT